MNATPADVRDGIMPYAEAPLQALAPHHPYDLSLDLVVPTTEANIVLGNFMTTLTLTTTSNKTLTSVRRAVRYRHPSFRTSGGEIESIL